MTTPSTISVRRFSCPGSWTAPASTVGTAREADLYKRCNQEAQRLLAEHHVIPKPPEILKEIEKVTRGAHEPACAERLLRRFIFQRSCVWLDRFGQCGGDAAMQGWAPGVLLRMLENVLEVGERPEDLVVTPRGAAGGQELDSFSTDRAPPFQGMEEGRPCQFQSGKPIGLFHHVRRRAR